jgi:hypothetical protein
VRPKADTGINDRVAIDAEWARSIEKDARARRHPINSRLIAAIYNENVGCWGRTADLSPDSVEFVPAAPRDRKTQFPIPMLHHIGERLPPNEPSRTIEYEIIRPVRHWALAAVMIGGGSLLGGMSAAGTASAGWPAVMCRIG